MNTDGLSGLEDPDFFFFVTVSRTQIIIRVQYTDTYVVGATGGMVRCSVWVPLNLGTIQRYPHLAPYKVFLCVPVFTAGEGEIEQAREKGCGMHFLQIEGRWIE